MKRNVILGCLCSLFLPFSSIWAYSVYSSYSEMVAAANPDLPSVTALTSGPIYHWFSYYDVWQFDVTDRYVLGMQVGFEGRSPTAEDQITLGFIDTQNGYAWTSFATTRAWCWQQGCRLQWRPGSNTEIIYNDRDGDHYVSRIYDIQTQQTRTLPYPVYHITPDGQSAVGLDFARLDDCRPGYGYEGVSDPYANENAPAQSGIYRMNLDSGDYTFLISLADIALLRYGSTSAPHKLWFNHLEWNPAGSRFLFFSRGDGTSVYTANHNGGDIRFLASNSSHYTWRDDNHVLIWSNSYRLYEDNGTGQSASLWSAPNGHQTYLPGNNWIVTDTYPDGNRNQHLYLYHVPTGSFVPLGRFYSPSAYSGEWRCDLHPRISRNGTKVIIDSPHGGNGRQLYLIDIEDIIHNFVFTPSAASPLNRARGVSINLDKIQWNTDEQSAAYDVYFGDDENAVATADDTVPPGSGVYLGRTENHSMDLPSAILPELTNYYWRVDRVDENGSVIGQGDVWSFQTAGLLALWSFEETTGAAVLDSSGRGHHGTMYGNVIRIADGPKGRALAFGGTNGYIFVSDSDDLDIATGSMTWSFYLRSNISDRRLLFSHRSDSNHYINMEWTADDILFLDINVDGDRSKIYSTTSLQTGATYHVSFQLDRRSSMPTGKIFINNQDDTDITRSYVTTGHYSVPGEVNIGRWQGGGYYWNGMLDEIRLYSGIDNPCSQWLPADINHDCLVNLQDLLHMTHNWMRCTLVNGDCP